MISHTAYYNRVNGKNLFTKEERDLLRDYLEVSDEEICSVIPLVRKCDAEGPDYQNLQKLKKMLKERGSMYKVADFLGIGQTTVFRRLAGISLFTRTEKEKLRQYLNISRQEIDTLIPVTRPNRDKRKR